MEPILEWAKKWESVVVVIGTILLVWLTLWLVLRGRKTHRIGVAPSLGLGFADPRNRPRLQVTHIEGGVAYDLLLDDFIGTLDGRPVRCSFRSIPHLRQGESMDLRADVEGLTESPDGYVFYEGDVWLEVLRSATGRETGLPLQMRYRDGANTRYIVKVTMPHLIHLGMGLLNAWPVYSRPIPMTMLARLEDRIIWPLTRAWRQWRIRRERRPRRRPWRTTA